MEHPEGRKLRNKKLIQWFALVLGDIILLSILHLLFPNLQSFTALVSGGGVTAVILLMGEVIGQNTRLIIRNETNIKTYSNVEIEESKNFKARLDLIKRLNRQLIFAKDEIEIINFTIDMINDLTRAKGITFVPFDEYGFPLPPFVKGSLPEADLKAWAEQVVSANTKYACQNCKELHATSTAQCSLLSIKVINAIRIECFPIKRDGETMGMLNLFLPKEVTLADTSRDFFEGVLNEMVIAAENIRLRNQEKRLLHQLHIPPTIKGDMSTALNDLLDHIQTIMDPDFAVLLLHLSEGSQGQQVFTRGQIPPQLPTYLHDLLENVLQDEQSIINENVNDEDTFPSGQGSIIATPILLSGGGSVGAVGIGIKHPKKFHREQLLLLQMVGVQIAQLVDQERAMSELEFQAVKKERTRLAREIHDGLAQTIAVLKLQTGQMQNYLVQKDISKLDQMLKLNHQTLAEAYVEIRQSIDNLRISPTEDLHQWLEQISDDFYRVTGININLDLTETQTTANLSSEIQAQLIRIIQESLSNIRKHAHASHVLISINEWNGDFVLEIRDDGQGFSPEDIPAFSQYGLRGMRERAELIGADFQITSHQRTGTTISVHVPIPFGEIER